MTNFGWIAPSAEPPARVDLRREGWSLCCSANDGLPDCGAVLLVDARGLDEVALGALVTCNPPLSRLVVFGVDEEAKRAALLGLGCGEVLPSGIGLAELHVRAQRVAERLQMLPRRRLIGSLTLDLIYRDARHGRQWLRLHPREFEVLWRLADRPGTVVTRRDLLRDVWRISQEPETNSVEVHVSRLRTKLAGAGCAGFVATVPEGGYRLVEAPGMANAPDPAQVNEL